MPLDKGKLQKLYSTLQQGGYSQSYDEFEKGFTGNDNYPNRKKVYDLLTEHGANIGKTYEDFMGKMQAPPQPSQPQHQNTPAPAPAPKPQPKPKGGGMTAAERAQFIRNAQGIVHQSAAGLQRAKNQMDYANSNRGLKVDPVHLGQNAKVVRRHVNGTVAKPRPVFDVAPEQQPGDTYLTESGNEFASRAEADTEQNAVDQYRYDQSETGQLNNAYAEAERLDKLLEQHGKELDDENRDKWWRDLPRGGGGAVSTMNANDNNGRMTDTEYLNLLAARKKVDEQIRDLKAARDEKTGTFLGGLWRGFRDYAFDPSNWDNGYSDLLTTSAMLRAKTGAAQTPREKASERMMMEDTYKAGVAAQQAEKVLGNGYRFMRIGAQSLPFALQFMAGNATGMIGGLTRAGEGMGVKLARKIAIKQGANNMMRNIGRSVLKNTGVMLGDLGAATALTTTIQAGQTGADIGQRYAGDVTYDPKTDDYKLEGGKSLGRSIYEGVANSTIENYTEQLGEHMHLGKFASSALTKMGLGRVSNWFTKVGKTDFMQGVNKYMKMAGFNGYPQEVMEEEVGIPLHAIFDGGNKMSDLLDGRQQLDIVGGMLFSMAGMGGASMVMQGGHKAAMAVQYHQDQHKLDNADKVASFRLTADKWAPIKDEIDGTTNEDFGKVMKDVLSNDELSDQEKQAVWDYAQRLVIMRGHNMGQEAATRNGMTDKETNTANESYTQGYNTTDATAMNDAKNRLAAAQQKFDEYMEQTGRERWEGEPSMQDIQHRHRDAQSLLNDKWADDTPVYNENDEEYKLAQAVVNAQQEYEGMMQRVRDDIDDEVQQTGAIYDSRTNSNGMIQSATLKAQNPDGTDKKVYITSGNVVMTDDGKSVDNQKSDMSIVVVDEDGKVQMISPDELFSLDTPIDGAQAKQQAIDAIQQSKAQEAADKINGKVNLTAGNTYTLTDNTGQQIAATIVADGQTGAVQNPDGTVNVSMNGKVVAMDVNTLQQMVDNTNMQRTAQGDEDGGQEQPTEQEGDQGILDQGGTVEPEGGTVVPEGGNIVDLSNIGEGEGEEGGGTVVQGDEVSGAVPTYPGGVVAPDMSEPHQWQVDDTFTIDNGGMPIRGQVTGVGEDGVEIYTESPVNGKKMQVVSPEELQSMTTEINGETVQAPQDEAAAEQRPTEPSPTEQSGVNGVNGEQAQEQAPQTQEQAQPQQADGEQPARAIDRIPSQQIDDGKGNVRTVHSWEQAEPGDTYDALTEIYHGNADRVKKGIDNRVGKIDKAIKGVHKQMDAIDNSDDFDEVAAQSEQYDQLQQQKDELEKQKKYWQGVQMVPRNRKMDADRRSAEEQAAAKAAQEKAEAEAAEKARQERKQVNGVPDVVNDIPADARKRGFRNVNGMVVNRQGETQGVSGRESNVKFSSTDTAKGHIKVIDADELQPSHVSGQRNPSFFIDEAQPKDRTDTVSGMAAAKIAADLNPEEITGDGSAYQFSAPTVNSRGEVIQGNNRSDALKLMYSNPAFKPAQDAYKQYIADHAEEFGFTPEDVAKIQQMEHPVMVNELDVPDDEAIRLGQMRASDNESGGIERIDPVTTSQKLDGKVSSFANVLLSSPDEDASLSDVLMQNGAKAVNWLATQGAISDTAAQSAFDKKGNLTPEARMDLQNILKQSLFQGGVSDLPTMFDKMPAKAQKAILSTFMRDFDSAESERILPEIQRAIEAWYDCAMSNEAFAKASNYKGAKNAMHDWERQTNMLDDNMPSDKFSNFARELACRLQGCSMRETQQSLNDFFDLVQGKSQGDLFGGTTMGEQADRQESIRRIFNIEYKPISNGKTRSNAVADNSSQSGEGRQGSPTDGKGRERAESGSGSANGAGGTESHDEEGIKATHVDTYGHGSRTIYKNLKTGKVTVIFGEGDKANRNGGKYNVRTAAEQQPTEPSGDSSHRNDSSHSIGSTSSSEKKETERQGVNTEPTEKQKEAGNYKKGHIKVDGYDITIENPKGSTRSDKDASGKAWSVPMHYDYGYIKGTEGVDGDHIDVYLSDNPTSGNVYVIDQIDQKTGKFDEHKVMYGFPSKEAAVEAYKGQYEKGWKVGTVTEVSREDFKKWVESSKRKTKPFGEYKSVKEAAVERQPTQPSASTERTEQKQKRTTTKGKTEKPKKANAGQFGLVSDERMEELKKRLRAKLNNLNMGVDPEVLAIGLELTAGYIDRGVKKFAEYSKAMINDLGDVVRPYLKAFYNGVRDMPEITSNGLDAEMDDYETVSKFNVATIGKDGEDTKPSILDTAEQVSNESHVERAASNVSDEDVKSEQKKLKGEEKQSGLHEVDTDRLFKDLKAGKTVVLNDYYKDENMSKGMDLMIEEAHDKFLSKLNTFKGKPTREMLEKALKDREQWIDELADMFKKGKTEGVVNGKYQKNVDVAGSLANMLGERKAIQELLGMGLNGGSTAQQRRTEPSEKKENTRYSERGFTLRPATEEDVEKNMPIYVDGKRTHIVMLVRKGEQVGAAQFSKPVIEAVYTTDNERVPLSKIEVEDLPTTVHLKTAGDFYEAYGNDAVALGEVTGVSVVTRKDGTRMAGFPKKMLDEYEQGLRNNGWDVSVDGMATKKATEKILQQMQSAPKAKTSTNAIKNALRGKKTSSKENNEKKKAVSSQQEPSLFDDLFGGEEAAAKQQPTEQKATEQTSGQGTTEQQPAVITTDDEKGKEKPIETKPEKELSGDSAEYQQRQIQEKNFVIEIQNAIEDDAAYGKYDHKLTMSDIKKMAQKYDLLKDYKDTDMQELVERAMTLATRQVAQADINKDEQTKKAGFDEVVRLYQSQPSLNARDTSRVAHQQYSTPTPFGYVMDMFMMGGDKKPLKLLEPSAGNGALTIGIPAPLWHVNDIDERRLMNLRTMPYGRITNQDGTMPFEPKAYDAVATNPPFGSTQEKEFDGGRTKITSLEGLMAINALASMKDDGRAAIIIGGNTQYMSNGAMQAKDMKLFKHLYTHYNVVDVINLDGDMYKRNGTGYNVRMILIAGRKTDVGDNPEKFTFPPVKKKARAEQVKTFDELYKRVEDDIQQAKQMEREPSAAVNSDGSQPVNSASERTGNSEAAGGVQQQPVRAGEMERRPQPGRSVRPSSAQDGRGNGERGQHGSADRLDNADGRDAGSNNTVQGNRPTQGQSSERREVGSTGRGTVGGNQRGGTSERNNTTGERPAITKNAEAQPQRTEPRAPQAPRQKVELGQEKVAYPNKSQSMTLQSRVPAAQAEAIAENLDKLGDVDEMVRSELGYSSKDELYSHLAAEQIDSVALAINQMKHGKGFIIGDMTGVGKGRQGAALIRWAIKQGKTPIYFTQKARLYTDNYRDMCDIGSNGLRPFLIASNDDGNIVENVVDENGEKVYDKNGEPVTRVVYGLPKPKERERVYDYIFQNGKLPPEYDYVLVTYSQIQSGTKTYEIGKNGEIEVKDKKYKGKTPGADKNGDIRRDVLETLAKDNYVFLDESHTVGGQSSSGLYMQDLLKGAEGVTYLSATFAKRPDNMPLYAMKTAMSESGLSQKDMIDAIQNGGVTLQEIMSKQLVQSGQMIRRERDFTGVSIDWEGVDEETDKQQRAQFDEVAKIFNAIREFQDNYVDPSIEKMSEDMAEEGMFSKKTQGTSHMGVNNVPFASKMYNLVNQLLFSLKANAVADKAIECLKKGEKPVISFNNTMEGFLDDMPRNTPMPELPNFSLTLMRALEGTLRYTEGEVGNKDNQVNKTLNINDLGDEAVAKYNEIRKTILNLSIGLPIDPMDAIKMRIEAAGYKVGEITGRKSEMVMDAEGNYIVQSRSSKEMDGKAAASAFNSASGKNGGLDVLLINKSGSTGISLHASSKFSDQSPRVMIAAQFQSDINDEVQMRGRIDRTGQVHRGRYIYLVSSIPAEQRLQMMFKNKLKSLDANTTSSQKSKFNEMEVTDFMNKYGDEVTWSYMMEHPDLEDRLGDPLDMLSDESKKSNRRGGDEENNPNSGCAGKILRRLPFLSVKEQEQIFNDLADAYKVKMQILNDAGENDLEITTMPLRAETKSRKVWKQGSDPGSDNAFADNTYLETAEVDVLKKPMKAKEAREYADRLTDGKPWEQWHEEQHEAVEKFYADKAKAVEDKAKAEAQKRINKAREDYIKGCLKARKKGDNNWSDEEISHMADIAAKEAADKEQTKINKRTVSIDAQRNDVLGALDAFTPLEPLIIPLNLKDTSTTVIPSLGTFLGIKFGKGYSRSSSTAVFATLDGRRKIEVPLSDKTSLENIKHQSVMLGYQARGLSMDNWDSKVPTKSRKTAYIVTGNLMQALVDTQKSPETKGQLISYTTIDGDVKQGILMNDRFKEEDLKTSVPISAMLQKIIDGDAVESADKEVKIERGMSYHYNDFKLSVPKSKSRGGKYFLDKKLLRLLDDEFTTSGSNMTAWVSQQNLKKVLDYLSKTLGVTVQVKANLEETADSPHNDEPATPSEAEEGGVLYREVDDEEAARLDSEPTVKVYRAMQEHDGKLYPPMSGRVKTQVETKKGTLRTKWVWRSPIEIGKWEQSEEHPEMANEDGTFTLDKGNGSTINAAYNPYIHTSRTPINDQFSSAWNRPELVTVEVEVPVSELTSGYHAEKAKDSTGEVEWKSGPVGREMAAQGNPRMVILSRWDKPVRIVPVDEVADEYAVRLAGTGIKVPFNTVPPALRDALVARGVEISEPEEGNAGKASRPSYEEWLKGNTRRREGSGAYSDEELSLMNDPVAKWLGKSNRTKAQQKAFANRERKSMESAAKELADRLHLDNVNIVMDASTLEGRKARAKGFYDRNTNEITIVIPNHRDIDDVMQTLLHEGVAHYGLRKMFGSHFDMFLDNVYAAADNDVRRRITELALSKYGGDFRVATEEYLASLAEQTDFEHIPETFWQKIKDFFLDMLHAIGFADFADKYDFTLSDNELRYILWRSYENLKEPGRYRSILGEAEDVAKQAELQVGNYAPESLDSSDNRVAEASPKLSSVKNEFGKPFVLSSKGSIDMGFIDKASGLKEAPIRLSEGEDIVDEDGKHHGYGLLHIAAEHEGEIRNASYNSVEEFVEDVASNYNTIREGNVVANNQTYLVELTDKHNNTLYVELSRDGKYWNINSAGVFRKGYSKNKKEVYSRPAIGSSSGTRTAGVNHGVNNSATVTSGNSPLTPNAKIGNNSERGVNNSENVSEPKSWGKQDLMSKAEQISNGIEPDLLFRDTIEDDDNTARETYDRWADQAKEQFREAWQDSMINVRNLQEAVLKQRGEKLEPYEDAYNEENRSHGIGQDKSEYFTDNLYKPLIASVNEAAKKAKVSIGDVTTYMMAKHGLERNEAFAKRDADAAWTKYQEKQKAKFDEYQKAHPNGKQTLADFIKKSYDDFYNDYREKDYSGLTSLTDTDNVQDAEAEAQRIIADMERKTDTKDIWDKVNAATKWTLHQAHESGIISRDNYQSVKDMFKYYIPLRGWNEDTAGDIYDYVGSAKGTAFSPTLAKAKGRKSQADNPIAYIGSMGISAIIQGERNRVKQAFMRFAENHPTNLVMVSEMWYRNFGTDTAPDWREDVPNIPENTSADQVAAIVEQHEKDMKALEAQGLATKRRGRLHLGVPIKPKEATEHHVEVMLNGKKYVLYINGNPRAAQALNGTRAKRAQEHSTTAKLDDIAKNFEDMHNWIGRRLASLTRMLAHGQRWMGARFTSKNPAFILSNAMRDVDMALASTAIKESPMYALRFRLNLARLVGPVRMLGLKHWYENYRAAGGNSAGLTGLKKYFYEFNAGGARTGFTSLKDIKDYKKEIEKMVKQSQQSVVNPRRWLRVLGDGFEFANSAVEDMTRFATFMASRQSGRTVRESVTDAKNITLNFNRKGSGEMGNATIREMQIFVNPAIQSLQTIASLATHHPVKFSAYTALRVLIGIGTPFATSLLWSIFGGGNGDDDDWNAEDEYWKLPTWTRRSNFVCWIPGTHKFLMIPLAQEFRVMNGFGETIASAMTGNSDENPALEMLSQTSGLLPIDFTGNGNNPFITLSPTIIQPLMQIRFNTDFTGRPIYKDSEWNKYEPASQKAYIGTPGELVDWSAKINNHTGGNEHKQGWWERTLAGKYANNPAIVDHFLKGYYGGLYSFIAQLGGLAFHAYNGESPDVQEIPMANRLVTAPREKLQNGKMKMPVWYYDMLDDNKRYMDEVNGYRKDMLANKPGAEKHFMEMTKTDEFMKQQQVNALMNGINQIRAAMPTVENSQNDEDAKTKQELEGGIKEILSELEKIRKTGKPLE